VAGKGPESKRVMSESGKKEKRPIKAQEENRAECKPRKRRGSAYERKIQRMRAQKETVPDLSSRKRTSNE